MSLTIAGVTARALNFDTLNLGHNANFDADDVFNGAGVDGVLNELLRKNSEFMENPPNPAYSR